MLFGVNRLIRLVGLIGLVGFRLACGAAVVLSTGLPRRWCRRRPVNRISSCTTGASTRSTPTQPWAEAVAICGERIVAVGTSAEVLAGARPETRRIDLAGRLVVPGFNDSHVHLIDGANELVEVDLRSASSAREVASRLQGYVATQPKGRWILGGFWDHEAWPGRQLPTRADIDAVTPDHPVFVQRLDGHMGLANSLALKLAGITRDTPVPDGGAIVRDAAGEPTGMLKDNAMDLINRVVPPPGLEETLTKARAGLAHAARLGVTTVQDMTTERHGADGVPAAARVGRAAGAHHLPPEPADPEPGGGGHLHGLWRRLAAHRRDQALCRRRDGIGHGGVLCAVRRRSLDHRAC